MSWACSLVWNGGARNSHSAFAAVRVVVPGEKLYPPDVNSGPATGRMVRLLA